MNTPRIFMVFGVLSLIVIAALLSGVDNTDARGFRPHYGKESHQSFRGHDTATPRFGTYDRAYSPAPQRDFQLQGRGLGE